MPFAYSSSYQYPTVPTRRYLDARPAPADSAVSTTDPLKVLKSSTLSTSSQSPRSGYNVVEQGQATTFDRQMSGKARLDAVPSKLDLHKRSIHVPLRTRRSSPRLRQPSRSLSSTPVSVGSSNDTSETHATSLELNPLQIKGFEASSDRLDPLQEYDHGSFDLVPPPEPNPSVFSLEERSQQLFSRDHLQVIFSDPSLLLRFTSFLSTSRPRSVPVLIYYLDALKALKALAYANAIIEGLESIPGHIFTDSPIEPTINSALREKASKAFDVLVQEDLPAYITETYIRIVSLSVTRRITGTLASHLREASEGLAEVFCLSDPSRPDNPIVLASQEFHRTTQYGMNYAIGRNCRFLQGPKTSPFSVRRLREAIALGKEHSEVFLNYRRDGSPFMNLLMIAPLYDSRGVIRYTIGAQVDVSGLLKACTEFESLERLVMAQQSEARGTRSEGADHSEPIENCFQELSEMLNTVELNTVRKWGGRIHRKHQEKENSTGALGVFHKSRLVLNEQSSDLEKTPNLHHYANGRLNGIYQHYLLVRPYPSLRVLFTSPSLRVPGILQSPFMDKIGGSSRVQDELTAAFAEGRGVTAKVRWATKSDEGGKCRWIHCTPLIGSNGQVGVWMIVLVDDDSDTIARLRQAPSVHSNGGNPDLGLSRGQKLVTDDEYFLNMTTSTERPEDTSTSCKAVDSVQGGSTRSASSYSLRGW